jgi:hypothetical protein
MRKIGQLDIRLLMEAIIVGLMVVIVHSIVSLVIKDSILLSIFISGILVHLGCEFSGIN